MKKLFRNTDNQLIAGVCSGIADYFNIDVTILRILLTFSIIFFWFIPIVMYLVAWILMPEKIKE